jgi:C-terminus of AA_permease
MTSPPFSLLLMFGLPLDTLLRLVVWLVIGLVIYFSYGHRHSLVPEPPPYETPGPRRCVCSAVFAPGVGGTGRTVRPGWQRRHGPSV